MNLKYLYFIYQCYNINVYTLVSYATFETKFQTDQKTHKNSPKTPCQKLSKNSQKSFMISLTKNPIKILNNNKNPLTSSNKTKTDEQT